MGVGGSLEEQLKNTNDRFFGIENFGNTCYINSVLQALYASVPFRNKLVEYFDDKNTPREKNLLYELAKVFSSIKNNRKTTGVIAPKAFLNQLRKDIILFDNSYQHDAQELLLYLFSNLNDILKEKSKMEKKKKGKSNSPKSTPDKTNDTKNTQKKEEKEEKEEKSFVNDIFQGKLATTIKCLCCEKVSTRTEPFMVLPVGVEQDTSLNYLLKKFSHEELLTGSNPFFCENCNTYQEAHKSTKIGKLPDILIVHLKRFKFVEKIGRFRKLEYRIACPFELKVTNFSSDMSKNDYNQMYELYGVVCHRGISPNCGHYYSYIKAHDTWIIFNDESVRLVDKEKVRFTYGNKGAYDTSYLLFYGKEGVLRGLKKKKKVIQKKETPKKEEEEEDEKEEDEDEKKK